MTPTMYAEHGPVTGAYTNSGQAVLVETGSHTERRLSYRFYPHFHPYVGDLMKRLIEDSIAGLQTADTDYVHKADGSLEMLPALPGQPAQARPKLYSEIFNTTNYDPTAMVSQPYPVRELDFTSSGAYSVYNWELFFHVPFSIAINLSRNQRFEDAQKWFHLVFDPTDSSNGPTPERFWKVRPFQYTDVKKIEEVMLNLATGKDAQLQQDTIDSINAWKEAPFRPHVIARYRQSAYMLKTVRAYLDNLIAWGDSLFAQDTGEAINEAMQIYVLAANILGPRPQAVPKKGSVEPQTYDSLSKHLDAFGNALVDFEADIPFDIAPPTTPPSGNPGTGTVATIGQTLYFAIPRNDRLMAYWDTVADRLFKIRNSLNLQGVFRQLPLFDPPIDPALLAKAAAGGVDIGAVVSGANQPLPLVRFQTLVQRATEICQEVKSLGNGLLSAIEKQDGEVLGALRARHERTILEANEAIKYAQFQEATKSREGLEISLFNASERFSYFQRQLGVAESDISIPELEALDKDALAKLKLKAKEPSMDQPKVEVDIATDLAQTAGGKKISSYELKEMELLEGARMLQIEASVIELIGSILGLIPQIGADVKPIGIGAGADFGGVELSRMLGGMASIAKIGAEQLNYEAGKTGKIGGYARREQEWAAQSNTIAGEINQTYKQLRAAQIREAIAELEWKNHGTQIQHAQDVEHFLAGEKNSTGHQKITTDALYAWMRREVKGLYGDCFKLAFDVAKKAERALQHELGDANTTYLRGGYLAGTEGLMAGESLYLDIKRMETAFNDRNQREYELTKSISLKQVDPRALLELRNTGRCTLVLPEEAYDIDGPGHYFRRIRSLAVSVPCVVGPYSSVNCTLTQTKSSIRTSPVVGDGYAREDSEDIRFSDHFGSSQSIVTSGGQNDGGMFETNLRDERFLPFEGTGAVGEWQVALPAQKPGEPRQFDYDTISDVILHVRYTAREGGGLLRDAAMANLGQRIDEAQAAGSMQLFSLRHEFPTAWAQFKSGASGAGQLNIQLREEHFPLWSKGRVAGLKRADLFARSTGGALTVSGDGGTTSDSFAAVGLGTVKAARLTAAPATPLDAFALDFNRKTIDDLWLLVTWGAED